MTITTAERKEKYPKSYERKRARTAIYAEVYGPIRSYDTQTHRRLNNWDEGHPRYNSTRVRHASVDLSVLASQWKKAAFPGNNPVRGDLGRLIGEPALKQLES